jgi:cell division protein FtsB
MKLDVANKKLLAEKQKLNEQNANLEKQRAALAASAASQSDAPSIGSK